jgi:subtilisin family serine protease
VKVLDKNGSGSFSSVANGIVWAVKNQMQVINMSLGGSGGSQALHDAVKAASDAEILVVSAAGNSGCCNTVLYPAKISRVDGDRRGGCERSASVVFLDRAGSDRRGAGREDPLDGSDGLVCAV